MKIKNKILVYISATATVIMLIAFVFIYIPFAGYREEEFQQQQNDKIRTTLKLIEQFKDQSAEISYLLDEQDIYDFYDEKLLVYNSEKELIFSSLDDLTIERGDEVLKQLSPELDWIETKEGKYDLIGVYKVRNNQEYYALSKAYDAYGYTKLDFLRNVLIIIFILIAVIIVLISIYIAKTISDPISELESMINNYKIGQEGNEPISLDTTTKELINLTEKFNDLLAHTDESFRFQKHTINHISHQLKTPIAVLVSELEKIQAESTEFEIQQKLDQQKIKAKSLGGIINVLLEISKIESGQTIEMHKQRVDELIFDCFVELNIIHTDFNFNVNYSPTDMQESDLMIEMNSTLLKQAFSNLLSNSVSYSNQSNSDVNFIVENNRLKIQFSNTGKSISEEEKKMLFRHFFRGESSEGKIGYGLGLMLTKRILDIHNAEITYERIGEENVFEVGF